MSTSCKSCKRLSALAHEIALEYVFPFRRQRHFSSKLDRLTRPDLTPRKRETEVIQIDQLTARIKQVNAKTDRAEACIRRQPDCTPNVFGNDVQQKLLLF